MFRVPSSPPFFSTRYKKKTDTPKRACQFLCQWGFFGIFSNLRDCWPERAGVKLFVLDAAAKPYHTRHSGMTQLAST